jgi:hypothetical protein
VLGLALTCSTGMAQTGTGLQTNSITNTFETAGQTSFFTGGDILGAQYLYCGQGLSALKGQAMTNDPTMDAVTLALQNTPTGATWTLAYKTNGALANPTNVASMSTTTVPGTWTLTFNSVTNVTMSGPGGVSTNFNLPDPSGETAALFADDVNIYFGVSAQNSAGANDHVVFSEFKVTGTASDFDDIFANDNGNLNGVWTANANAPVTVQMVAPGNPYWVTWTQPAADYTLATSSSLSVGNTWTQVVDNPVFFVSTNFNQLINVNDLPAGKTGFFSLIQPAP